TAAGGAELRVVDRGRGRDPREASAEAEDGSPGCATDSALVAGKSLSPGVGPELGESRSAATALASSPDDAGAHADHEPTASRSAQRRAALQKEVVAGGGTRATGVVSLSALGEPATARSAGVAGPADADDCRVDAGHRAGGGEVSGGATLADTSWSGGTDRAGLRADPGPSGSVSVWQADRELPRFGAVGRVQRTAAAVGTHHETRQLAPAFSAGGGGASYGAQRSRMAPPVFSPRAATRTEDCQGRDGTETGGSSVLDVAQGMGLPAVDKVRFARGRARKSRWCAVQHRVIDWASRSPSRGSSK